MNNFISILGGLLLLVAPLVANAYVGPGAGLSAIGSLLALVLAIVVAVIGFLWYPLKRLLKRRQEPTLDEADDEQQAEVVQNSEASQDSDPKKSTAEK